MSGEAAIVASANGARHRVLASMEIWRRTRVILIYMAVVMLVGEGITVFGGHKFAPSYLAVAILLLALAAGVYLRQRTHYVEVGPDGLVLHSMFRSEALPYDALRQSRCQPLRVFFEAPTRRELLTGGLKRFAGRPACIVRAERSHDELLKVGRVLGRRTVLDQDLIMLVERAEALDRALQSRIRRRPPTASAKPPRRR
ncbi:MAG: hypothetical protein ACYCZN_00700 [Candidatus Dormibacteria bacterium]